YGLRISPCRRLPHGAAGMPCRRHRRTAPMPLRRAKKFDPAHEPLSGFVRPTTKRGSGRFRSGAARRGTSMNDPPPGRTAAAAPDTRPGFAAMAARIEGSQIVADTRPVDWAPAGFDETDIRILEWIAAQRRSRRRASSAGVAA